MSRKIATAGAIVLALVQFGTSAPAQAQSREFCGAACRNIVASLPSAQDTIASGVARIAARATVPDTQSRALTQQEQIELFLLLSLQQNSTGRGR